MSLSAFSSFLVDSLNSLSRFDRLVSLALRSELIFEICLSSESFCDNRDSAASYSSLSSSSNLLFEAITTVR